jgi:hypothetical protein
MSQCRRLSSCARFTGAKKGGFATQVARLPVLRNLSVANCESCRKERRKTPVNTLIQARPIPHPGQVSVTED